MPEDFALSLYHGQDAVETFTANEQMLLRIEEELQQHLLAGHAHMQAAFVLMALIRHHRLYTYARDDDGEYFQTWEQYVQAAVRRFNVSRAWIFKRVNNFRLGLALGFSEEELFEIDVNTLDIASRLMSVNRNNALMIGHEEDLGLEEGDDDDTVLTKLRQFVLELNALPLSERIARVEGDILQKEKFYFQLEPNFDISYTSTLNPTPQLLRGAPPHVLTAFRRRIGDKGGAR